MGIRGFYTGGSSGVFKGGPFGDGPPSRCTLNFFDEKSTCTQRLGKAGAAGARAPTLTEGQLLSVAEGRYTADHLQICVVMSSLSCV